MGCGSSSSDASKKKEQEEMEQNDSMTLQNTSTAEEFRVDQNTLRYEGESSPLHAPGDPNVRCIYCHLLLPQSKAVDINAREGSGSYNLADDASPYLDYSCPECLIEHESFSGQKRRRTLSMEGDSNPSPPPSSMGASIGDRDEICRQEKVVASSPAAPPPPAEDDSIASPT